MIPLPTCPVHNGTHQPVLCHTELVWHPVVCVPKPRVKVVESPGTHMGHLSTEARDRRRAKNSRNFAARGNATRKPGRQKNVRLRLSRSLGRAV